jgi:phage-related holin
MNVIDWTVVIPCIMIVFDLVTGYIAAMFMGTVDSKKMRKGIYNKLGELFAIVLSYFIEFVISIYGAKAIGINVSLPIGAGMCAYVTLTELISVIENIGCMNPKIGAKLIELIGIKPDKVNLVVKGDDADND